MAGEGTVLALRRGYGLVHGMWVSTIDMVILIGQSNADGRALVSAQRSDLTNFYGVARPDLHVWYKPAVRSGSGVDAGSFANDGAWWQLHNTHDAGNSKTHQTIGNAGSTVAAQSAVSYGPETELGYLSQQEASPVPLYVMKAAVGGARIEVNWKVTTPDASALWTWFKDYVYAPAIAALPAGVTIRRFNVFWMQGESDADSNVTQSAYAASLQVLVDRLNGELFRAPDSIIIGGLSTGYNTTAGDAIEAAQKQVAAANPTVIFMPSDGSGVSAAYAVAGDTIHFNAAGIQAQAADLWALMKAPALRGVTAFDHGEDATNSAAYTFSGKAVSNGSVVVAVTHRQGSNVRTVTGVTVGGIAAQQIGGAGSVSSGLQSTTFWHAANVTAGNVGVAVALSGSTDRCGVCVWSIGDVPYEKCSAVFATSEVAATTIQQATAVLPGALVLAHLTSAQGLTSVAWDKANARLPATSIESTFEHAAADIEIAAGGALTVQATKANTSLTVLGLCTIVP